LNRDRTGWGGLLSSTIIIFQADRLLRDIEGQPVGMLYVGILQSKFDQILRQTTILYFVLIFLMTGIAIYISTYLVNVYTRPINRMIKLTAEVARGNYHLIDISPKESEEIREVEEFFNADRLKL